MSEEESEVEQLKRRLETVEAELADVKERCVLKEKSEALMRTVTEQTTTLTEDAQTEEELEEEETEELESTTESEPSEEEATEGNQEE